MYVLGIGTGRTGSQSFAAFMNQQKNCTFTHEGMDLTMLPLFQPYKRAMKKLNGYGGKWKGDISPGWSVWAPALLDARPDNVRIVWLVRDLDEVAQSFYNQKTKKMPNWLLAGNKLPGGFLGMYPVLEKEFSLEAIKRCVERWYWMSQSIMTIYPDHTFVYHYKDLNSVEEQAKFLDWLGMRRRDWVLGMPRVDEVKKRDDTVGRDTPRSGFDIR